MKGVKLSMTETGKDDLFYICSLIEFIGRRTKNRRKEVVNALGEQGIKKQLYDAQVNHCLSFEQVSEELIEQYQIPDGDFDTISNCKYKIPSFTAIGRLYSRLVLDCSKSGEEVEELFKIFNSFISDEISDFKTGVYFENTSYLEHSYREGYLLE